MERTGLWIANRNGSSSRQAARRRKRTAPSFDGLEGRRLLTSVVYQSGTIPADVAAEAVYVVRSRAPPTADVERGRR